MTVTVSSFRDDFPEFSNVTKYPESVVALWLGVASNMVSADRWGVMADLGMELFIAHNITLEAMNTAAAAVGKPPGTASGVVSSKSVGSVNVSYDTAAGTHTDGADYNLTSYGVRYLRFARMFGAGGVQL